jgi:hypothetical protein
MKRFDELVALVRADDHFFKNYETAMVGSPEYKHFHSYNEAFMLLDDESWNILKLKAIQHFPDEREGQRKQSFFNHLNEAFAYRYLREKGFDEVRFMKEGKKGPDISYVNRGMKYCEVKTIGLSEDEIGRRSSPHFYDGKVHMRLDDKFLNILRKVIDAARLQIYAVEGRGIAFVLVRFDDVTEDYIHTYRAQLTQFCAAEKGVVIKNGHIGNDIIQSPDA